MMEKARITTKRQLTLPVKIFQAADLKEGQEVTVTVENGRVVLTPGELIIKQLAGSLRDTLPAHWVGKDINLIIEEARQAYVRRYQKP